jgi:penicillin-binding protein 1A
MYENGFITATEARQAKAEELQLRRYQPDRFIRADYLVEMVRQVVFERYGEEAYTSGLQIYTTVDAQAQRDAYAAVRRGVLNFERNQFYRGPERFIDLPADPKTRERAIDDAIAASPDSNGLFTAVVLEATDRKVKLTRGDGTTI